ncbi:hypothetical protein NDN08_002380 [Rhodosorus marinus]|uniref:Glycosyltransferase 61 catalytic domain-containing protein n=1 Tax=Rhodosorus marinus TaxID=101924 RepID=A0AAV8UZB5_9RHOD|nr:hypothetical protein NDN08_002380 [Rhodosorus marinus]
MQLPRKPNPAGLRRRRGVLAWGLIAAFLVLLATSALVFMSFSGSSSLFPNLEAAEVDEDGFGEFDLNEEARENQIPEIEGTCGKHVSSFDLQKFPGHSPLGKLLLMTLNESSYCALPSACRSYEGALILPSWIKEHSDSLKACGIDMDKLTFYEEIPSEPDNYDLFGPNFQRFHFPHFMQDMVHIVTLFNIIFNSSSYQVTECTCHGQKGGPCAINGFEGWNPAVGVEQPVEAMDESSWVKSFLRLLPLEENGGPSLMYPEYAYPDDDNSEPKCFRTIFVGKPKRRGSSFASIPPEENLVFGENAIEKLPRTECPVRIVLINREPPQGLSDGRYITNLDEIKSELHLEAEKRDIDAEIIEVGFSNTSFEDQISTMNNADLVVSVHGAELTNIIWMRQGGKVVEILPFLYDPDIFVEMGNWARSEVVQISAEPDDERFTSCVLHFGEMWEKETYPAYLTKFEELGKQWRDGKEIERKDIKELTTSFVVRTCLRAQNLHVDSAFVARRAVSRLDFRCTS